MIKPNDDKFGVKVTKDKYGTYLCITNNGWQWAATTIENPKRDIPLIIKCLQKYLGKWKG